MPEHDAIRLSQVIALVHRLQLSGGDVLDQAREILVILRAPCWELRDAEADKGWSRPAGACRRIPAARTCWSTAPAPRISRAIPAHRSRKPSHRSGRIITGIHHGGTEATEKEGLRCAQKILLRALRASVVKLCYQTCMETAALADWRDAAPGKPGDYTGDESPASRVSGRGCGSRRAHRPSPRAAPPSTRRPSTSSPPAAARAETFLGAHGISILAADARPRRLCPRRGPGL